MTQNSNNIAKVSTWEGPLWEGDQVGNSHLEYITKSSSRVLDENPSNVRLGKGLQLVKIGQTDNEKIKINEARANRYLLQSVARKALPEQRVSICLRNRRSKDIDVEVWKHRHTQKTFFAGLLVCGSIWSCPVCAAKITERRKTELLHAATLHKASEGRMAMLTLTFSHKATDKLQEILQPFLKAASKFRSGGAYKKIMESIEAIGSIRAFEITYGSNGFHPHLHILIFYKKPVIMPLIELQLFKLWRKACLNQGLLTSREHGLNIKDQVKVSDYITKWGIEQELTKTHSKKGRKDSITPFDFLRKYLETEDEKYLYLFNQYATCLKGKTQLFWSPGLKDHFMIKEMSDEQLAIEKKEQADLLGIIPYYIWKRILMSDKRAQFQELCEDESFDLAMDMVSTFYSQNTLEYKKALQSKKTKGLRAE